MSTSTEAEVIKTIEEALKLKSDSITLESSLGSVEAWDSLGHLSILSALDKLFAGRIAGIKEMAEADSVKKILAILKQKALI